MRYLVVLFFSMLLAFLPLVSLAGVQSQAGCPIASAVAAADAPTPDQRPTETGRDSSGDGDC